MFRICPVFCWKCGNDPGLSGCIFHCPFGDDPGADQIWSRKCTGSDGGNLLFFAGVVLFVQKIAGEATLDQIAELLGTITGNVPGQAGILR